MSLCYPCGPQTLRTPGISLSMVFWDFVYILIVSMFFTAHTRTSMNFRARDNTWLSILDDVMKSDGDLTSGSVGAHSDDVLIHKYKDLSKKRMKLWWNRAFLNKYLERDLVPRGLRVQVFPSFPVEDDKFRTKWETLARTCSKGFLALLCDHNSRSLTQIESELESLDKMITDKCDTPTITRFNSEMEKEIEKWEKEIKIYKIKKLNRDLLDYSSNKAYRWKMEYTRGRQFTRPGKNQRSRSTSLASQTSGEGSSSGASESSNIPVETVGDRVKQRNRQFVPLGKNKKQGNKLQVINLSERTLSGAQIEVLSRGLTFAPSNSFHLVTALKDVNLFARKLILKKLFHKKDSVTDSQAEREAINNLEELLQEQEAPSTGAFPQSLLPRSTKFPPLSLCPAVDIFVRLVSEDFRKIDTKRRRDNLTYKQRKALTELQGYSDIVIKPADKGGNIVIMSVEKYEREVTRQLREKATYMRLPSNPLEKYISELAVILDRALEIGLIDKKMYDGLCRKYPKIPTFYILPKIHKDAVNPPGRPIVSGMEGMCDPICKFIDYYLQPMVETLPSYVRDTTDVLRRIDGIFLEEDMTIVTADVEGLYTCIVHEDGLRAVRFFLEASGRGDDMGELILELLHFILTHNFFVFKDYFYLQKRGTAMGAACVPSYAGLFLGYWERLVFGDGGVEASAHVQCWYRFIDDILFVWQVEQLDRFMGQLNKNKFNIKLTYKCSSRMIDFLDVKITVDDRGSIQTDVFRKDTSVNALLHASSAHNPSTIRAIPTGQFLRMKRICSSDNNFETQSSDLRARFLDRGYSNRTIKHGYHRARITPRAKLLVQAPKKQEAYDPVIRFIGTYNERWNTMRDIITKHWSV
ncbi:uncharacterized protein ACNLHF_014260 isoform 1-T2 [Anomaloglossus baeobatrachus]|uniref:uncharacterized protein LOC142295626 n=1 Tax=Anomaloglossus baeobatrachus TaxID=238106 RepID=UPI003F4F403E